MAHLNESAASDMWDDPESIISLDSGDDCDNSLLRDNASSIALTSDEDSDGELASSAFNNSGWRRGISTWSAKRRLVAAREDSSTQLLQTLRQRDFDLHPDLKPGDPTNSNYADNLQASSGQDGYETDNDDAGNSISDKANKTDALIASRIPLPTSPRNLSPEKQIPRSQSPVKLSAIATPAFGATQQSDASSPDSYPASVALYSRTSRSPSKAPPRLPVIKPTATEPPPSDHFFRFAVRAEFKHRTEPLDASIDFFRSTVRYLTCNPLRATIYFVLLMLVSSFLFKQPEPVAGPDILQAVSIARRLEPLMYLSEIGLEEVFEINGAEMAVSDLIISVPTAHLTSGDQIIEELTNIHNHLQKLVPGLRSFFSQIDADMDWILMGLVFAKRHLESIKPPTGGALASAADNIHDLLNRAGLSSTLGMTRSQKNVAVAQLAFQRLLGVYEQNIHSQLEKSNYLFNHFEAIGHGFINLHRVVLVEDMALDQEEATRMSQEGLLSSLWTLFVGPDLAQMRTEELKRSRLQNLHNQTTHYKRLLKRHSSDLQLILSMIETARQGVSGVMLRTHVSDVAPLEDQILGLQMTWEQLKSIREQQERKKREASQRRLGPPPLAIEMGPSQ